MAERWATCFVFRCYEHLLSCAPQPGRRDVVRPSSACDVDRSAAEKLRTVVVFGSSVKASHGLPPVTAGIGVWLDGVGRAGTYSTAERMNGKKRLHRCRKGVPISNATRIKYRSTCNDRFEKTIGTKCVAISWTSGLGRATKRWGGNTSQTVKTLVHEWQATVSSTIREGEPELPRHAGLPTDSEHAECHVLDSSEVGPI